MPSPDNKSQTSGLNIGDVVFAIFKHKWKIILLSMAGLVAAGIVYKTSKPLYKSSSKLMVRYIMERSQFDLEFENQTNTGGRGGEHLVGAEIELLTSQDIARDVVDQLGAEKILPEDAEEPSPLKATATIVKNLEVTSSKGSNVIHVAFQHHEPAAATEILNALIERYFVKHLEIHRNREGYDFVSEKTDKVRSSLKTVETELYKLKTDAGILSLVDATSFLNEQRNDTRKDLRNAEVEVKAQSARVESLRAALATLEDGGQEEGEKVIDKDAKAATLSPEDLVADFQVAAKYGAIMNQLRFLRSEQLNLQAKFAPGNRQVQRNQEQIAQFEAQRDALVRKHPSLSASDPAMGGPVAGNPREHAVLLLVEGEAVLMSLQAGLEAYRSQDAALGEEFKKLMEVSSQIEDLERQQVVSDETFRHFAAALEKAKVDDALKPESMPNISYLQRPSFPSPTRSAIRTKLALGLAASGFILGIGWALLIELVVDRGVKRPSELETRLRIPLLMSIPRIGVSRDARRQQRLMARQGTAFDPGHDEDGDHREERALVIAGADSGSGFSPLTSAEHFIHPYADGIRDRLVYYFELNNLKHKPKLVALTSLMPGAGASTIARGLARSFAEESAKVLLIDLNTGAKTEKEERKGGYSLTGLAREGGEVEFEDAGGNLFLASMPTKPDGNGGKRFAARQFYDLIPRFRRSQFDYIIFDMPPLDDLSPSLAMAGFMDQVLLVLDAENTNREVLKRSHTELARGSADVTCIFNKARSHAPRWVHGEG